MKILILTLTLSAVSAFQLEPSCDKPVYCNSKLLHHVQMARIFPDSKTFVDLSMKNDEKSILNAFDQLLKETKDRPTKEQLELFVSENFEPFNELENWTPEDFVSDPSFLANIKDIEMRSFAKNIHNIWPVLGRKVKPIVHEKPENFSMIPVKNGFIIPGVKLNELYYWDTYWIVEGLLVSGMKDTVKGMLNNLVDLQRIFGHIPNGNRWYFQQRSQPPLLSAMVMKYLEATHDTDFLKSTIDALESELQYWIDTQSVVFEKDGKEYTLLRYFTPSKGPRPEWYYKDYTQAQTFDSEERQQQYYNDIKSAAESGWDFSSRWFINQNGTNIGNLTSIHASNIVPVDLNSMFTKAMQNMAYYYSLLHNPRKGAHWAHIAKQWRNSIKEVMWNDEDGIWYDWDLSYKIQRKYFYPSNIAPLWMEIVDTEFVNEHAPAILEYMKKTHSLEFPGGVPTSFSRTGQKWDYPYAWAPLVSMVVRSLEALKTEESEKFAFNVVKNWVRSNLLGYTAYKQLFDKYDVETPGRICKEEEYAIQAGFGWTSGVTLQMLARYGHVLKSQDDYYNFNTYKSNPTFWYIPTSAYLPSYYESSNTAPVLTELSPFSQFISTFTHKNVSEVSVQVEPIPPINVKPDEPALIGINGGPDPIKPEFIPSDGVKPWIVYSTTHQPELNPLLPVKLLPSVEVKPDLIPSTTFKPELVTFVPIKPELVATAEVRPLVPSAEVKPELIPSIVVKPKLIPSVVVKPELIPSPIIKPELIPSVIVKPEPSTVEKPWVIHSTKHQQKHEPLVPSKLIPSVEIKPTLIPFTTFKPELLSLLPIKPELVLAPETKPQVVPSAEVKPLLQKPYSHPSIVIKPERVSSVVPTPELIPYAEHKPQVLPAAVVRPELIPSEVVKPEAVSSVVAAPELIPTTVHKPQLLSSVAVKPELNASAVLKPYPLPSIVVKPELVPSVVPTPELIPSAEHKQHLIPSVVVKPQLIPSEVAKPELKPSAVLKPYPLPSIVVKPEPVPSVVIKSEVIPAKPVNHEQIYLGSVQDFSAHQKDFFIPEKPVAHVSSLPRTDQKILSTAFGEKQQYLPATQVSQPEAEHHSITLGQVQQEQKVSPQINQSDNYKPVQAEKVTTLSITENLSGAYSDSGVSGLGFATSGNSASGQAHWEHSASQQSSVPLPGFSVDYKPVQSEKVSSSVGHGPEFSESYNSASASGQAQLPQTSPLTSFSVGYKPIETEKATFEHTGSVAGALSGGLSAAVAEQTSGSYNPNVVASIISVH